MLELWGVQSIPLLPSIPDPLWPRVEAPDRIQSMSQIELNCVLMLNKIVWNRTFFYILCKQKTVLILKWIVRNRTFIIIKMDLALNNLQWLICLKPNQTIEVWVTASDCKSPQVYWILLTIAANSTPAETCANNWLLNCDCNIAILETI